MKFHKLVGGEGGLLLPPRTTFISSVINLPHSICPTSIWRS